MTSQQTSSLSHCRYADAWTLAAVPVKKFKMQSWDICLHKLKSVTVVTKLCLTEQWERHPSQLERVFQRHVRLVEKNTITAANVLVVVKTLKAGKVGKASGCDEIRIEMFKFWMLGRCVPGGLVFWEGTEGLDHWEDNDHPFTQTGRQEWMR